METGERTNETMVALAPSHAAIRTENAFIHTRTVGNRRVVEYYRVADSECTLDSTKSMQKNCVHMRISDDTLGCDKAILGNRSAHLTVRTDLTICDAGTIRKE